MDRQAGRQACLGNVMLGCVGFSGSFLPFEVEGREGEIENERGRLVVLRRLGYTAARYRTTNQPNNQPTNHPSIHPSIRPRYPYNSTRCPPIYHLLSTIYLSTYIHEPEPQPESQPEPT